MEHLEESRLERVLKLPSNVLRSILDSLKPDLEHRPQVSETTLANITIYGGERIDEAPIVNQLRTHEEE